MPGLYVSEEISVKAAANGRFHFSVKGGRARSTISWTVTTVECQEAGGVLSGIRGGGGGRVTASSTGTEDDSSESRGDRDQSKESQD